MKIGIRTLWAHKLLLHKGGSQTFKTLEGLEQFYKSGGGELLMVLGGNLDADLQVLPNVVRQHGLQTLQRILNRQRAEVVHQPLWKYEENEDVMGTSRF